MDQRSDEWFKARAGRFSASTISRLLGKEGLKRTQDSIDNYAFEKAVESVFGRDEDQVVSWDMQRGIDLEPLAFKRFKELKQFDFIEVSECGFFPFGKHGGASPDGLVGDDAILEIKCPRRNKFFKIVAKGHEEINPEYYAQMQKQMLSTNSKRAHFFNYYVENGLEYWHELVVERDDEMINLIKERIKTATKIKLNYIRKLNKNKQW